MEGSSYSPGSSSDSLSAAYHTSTKAKNGLAPPEKVGAGKDKARANLILPMTYFAFSFMQYNSS